MTMLVGPCMFLAPLAAVLMLLALPLWPVAIGVMAVAWLITWAVEGILVAVGVRKTATWTRAVGKAFLTVLRPWSYFDPPKAGSTASPSGLDEPTSETRGP